MRLSHIALSLVRRCYFLFAGNFHWIGALGILAGLHAGRFRRRRWAVAGTFSLLHIVLVSVLGGAVLERYMVPVLPIFYAAALTGFATWSVNRRWLAYFAMVGGLIAGLFINPLFWPFPYENNLAIATFTRLHQRTARTIEEQFRGARVASNGASLNATTARSGCPGLSPCPNQRCYWIGLMSLPVTSSTTSPLSVSPNSFTTTPASRSACVKGSKSFF